MTIIILYHKCLHVLRAYADVLKNSQSFCVQCTHGVVVVAGVPQTYKVVIVFGFIDCGYRVDRVELENNKNLV